MSGPPPLPDLGTLSSAEKDELILALWKAIAAAEAARKPDAGSGPGPAAVSVLRARIGRAAPSRRGLRRSEPARSGRARASLLDSGLAVGVLAAVGLGFVVDFAVGALQRRSIEQAGRAALELRNAAFSGLFVELTRVSYEPDGRSYRATLAMQNANAAPLYVMLSLARVFVQTGLVWRGVKTRAAPGSNWGVVKLDGAREVELIFEADVENWTQLIPGYMHLRIQSDMLIARSSEPTNGEIVSRANRFNVYLKPHGADDAEIKRRMQFQGAPPAFIPMPPH